MVRYLKIAIWSIMIFCLTACGRQDMSEVVENEKLKIVTTVFPPYDFAKQIAKDEAEIVMLLKPGVESHAYEPTPRDIVSIQESDLFIYTGGESDEWVEDLLEGLERKPKQILRMMECVNPILEETIEKVEKTEEHETEEYDEHIWTSIPNAIKIVQGIEDKLILCDLEHAEVYQRNSENYQKELASLDKEFRDWRSTQSNPVLIFGDRFPFLYFVKEYDIAYYAAFPGCSAETEPSAKKMAFLIDEAKALGEHTIWKTELSNPKVANAIAEAVDGEVKVLHSCHNIAEEEVKQGGTYLSLMKRNLEVLKERGGR